MKQVASSSSPFRSFQLQYSGDMMYCARRFQVVNENVWICIVDVVIASNEDVWFFLCFFKSRSDLGARSVSCLYVDGMNVFAEMKPILAKCVFGLESVHL